MAYFEVKSIYKSYNKTSIIRNITFSMNKGEVLSIIGRSGGGKTTLLRCLNYLETIDSGEVYLDGKLLLSKDFPKKENELIKIRSHYGLVFQSFNLFPQYTVFQNIKLPLTLMEEKRKKEGLEPIVKDKIDEEIMGLLTKIGLENKRNFYPNQLSGGQSQRVAIARAMALKPDILCFDEPTSALDPELTGEVLKVIQELKDKYHLTMIIVTHEMAFAKRISDKVLFIDDGEIVEFGTPKEVFSSIKERTKSFLNSFINIDN